MDKYSQMAYINIVESAANTLTYSELALGNAFGERQAMVINKIEYQLSATVLALRAASDDNAIFGLSVSNVPSDTEINQSEIIDRTSLPYGVTPEVMPIQKIFNNMPGGGLLVPIKKLYGFCQGVSLASALTIKCRIWYTKMDLKDADYLEMVEAYNILR